MKPIRHTTTVRAWELVGEYPATAMPVFADMQIGVVKPMSCISAAVSAHYIALQLDALSYRDQQATKFLLLASFMLVVELLFIWVWL